MASGWVSRLPVHGPAAASTFAGLLGAGIIDGIFVLGRSTGAPLFHVLTLAVAVYGGLGLVAGLVMGWAVHVIVRGIPGGPGRLLNDPELDLLAATGTLCVFAGGVALAVLEAAVLAGFTSKMNSHTLATIAQAGLTLALLPVAALVSLWAVRPARALVSRLPRLRLLGWTGLVLLAAALLGLMAGGLALSRADWRVLDLAWMKALFLALWLGGAHAVFWYGTSLGRTVHARLPIVPMRASAVAAVAVAWLVGGRFDETSLAFTDIDKDSLGLRTGIALARRLSDGDGDGFAARFGGGDCDDSREDTYPGADDTPGDGIDQNCEGGDAQVQVEALAPAPEATPPPPTKQAAAEGSAFAGNILVISVDAFRADRLGVAGYKRRGGKSLTPTLDALAARGAYFRKVWSHAPNTPRSFPAFVTSRYPSEIAWEKRTANYSPILPTNQTVFDALGRAGLKPIGVFSHFYFTAERGLSKGFAEWTNDGAGTIAESNRDIPSPRIVPRVVARLKKAAANKERFVLWTHLFEPHSSYMEHKEFPTSLRGVEGLEEKYDYEIAFVDMWIGKLLAGLEKAGLAETTAVVVLADHGEAWGEHKFLFHGQDLTEEQLRVPLIITVPGRAPVTVDEPVALVDLGPTLLDLVGAPAPKAFRGRSLLPLVDGKTLPPRPVFSELLPANAWPHHQVMMVDDGHKLTHKISDRRWELHDLTSDPKQQRDVSSDPRRKAKLEAMRKRLLEFEEGRR